MRIILFACLLFFSHSPANGQDFWSVCDSKDYEKSILACSVLIAQATESESRAKAYVGRGESYRRHGENDLAISDYESAVRDSPRFAYAYERLAIVQMRKGDTKNALANARTS